MLIRFKTFLLLISGMALTFTSCVQKKKYMQLQKNYDVMSANYDAYMKKNNACETDNQRLKTELETTKNALQLRMEQITDLKSQLDDLRSQRDKQVSQVDNLTVLTQQASDNIKATLSQLERKDKYIRFLQAAKSKADSMNLALAVNLTGVLKDGIEDKDIDIKVDKTVVMVNISDRMLFESGSSRLNTSATQVLEKIARIVDARPELELMVEGYTDNVPIRNNCLTDNWDLSVKRATTVVRALQQAFNINPNRMIAAGRGEYNALMPNDTEEGKRANRRTRIIIMPKLDQFYELLNPNNVPE